MCLLAIAIGVSARWPLVIASNRDEFFDRPSLPLSCWQAASGRTIISGRDRLAGGTWLGATSDGRIALLTNVRELGAPLSEKSRGELVMRWLDGDMDAASFMAQTDSAAYGGFNLVLGDLKKSSWTWLSNRKFDRGAGNPWPDRPLGAAGAWQAQTLSPGIYGLSNASLDTPWQKTLALKRTLQTALQAPDKAALANSLWAALASRQKADIDELPDTGLPLELEAALSSAFVAEPLRGLAGYGTRCSSLLVAAPVEAHRSGRGHASGLALSLDERTYPAPKGGIPGGQTTFETAQESVNWVLANAETALDPVNS
jgi:uncharacterized protein with NRDE domain